MKNARAKILFFIVKYANLWGFRSLIYSHGWSRKLHTRERIFQKDPQRNLARASHKYKGIAILGLYRTNESLLTTSLVGQSNTITVMDSQLHGQLDAVVDRISVDKLAHEKQERIRYVVK